MFRIRFIHTVNFCVSHKKLLIMQYFSINFFYSLFSFLIEMRDFCKMFQCYSSFKITHLHIYLYIPALSDQYFIRFDVYGSNITDVPKTLGT